MQPSTTQSIAVGQLPDASIEDYDDDFTNCGSGIFNMNIYDESTTDLTNALYEIDWGDGSPLLLQASLPSPTNHSYTTQGYFDLVLTVTGQNGCSSTETYEVYNGSNPAVGLGNPGGTVSLCIPHILNFPISGAAANPPGTTYTITTNTGNPPVTLTHPPPTNYIHEFTTSSCGATDAVTPNTFKVSIRAENPCGFSDATVEPITTSIRPEANFDISPPDTIVCTNTIVNFTNTTIAGVSVDGFGVCDSTTKVNWVITPNSGWTIQSGSLGSSPPTNVPSTWGSNSLDVSFSQEGVYSISMVAGNDCGNDTITKYVCIQAPPVPDFNANPLTGCAPLVVNFTDASSDPPLCGPLQRNWTVSQLSSTCIADSNNDFDFVSGTNSSSINPIIGLPL